MVVPQELNAKKNPTNNAVNRIFVVLIALAPMTLNGEPSYFHFSKKKSNFIVFRSSYSLKFPIYFIGFTCSQ